MTEATKDILIAFGANLKRIRKNQNITLVDLEVSSGVHNGDISRIERGKVNLSFTTLAKLATGLDVPMSELVTFKK